MCPLGLAFLQDAGPGVVFLLSVDGEPQRRAMSGGPEGTLIGACMCIAWLALGTEPTFRFFPTENSEEFSSMSR